MPLRPLLIFLAMQAAAYPAAAQQNAPLTWWTTHSMQKVRPNDPMPFSRRHTAHLYAARNEFEAFQLVLRSDTQHVQGVDVDVSDFRNADGKGVISKENITVYLEEFINVQTPSTIEGAAGLWPDPLVPRVDRYAGERRNAFPFTVQQGLNQPVWIEVYVPSTAEPGSYSGLVTVSINGEAAFSVPATLTVWNFTLPSTASLKSSFGFSGVAAVKQHRGRYTTDADLYALTALYAKAALLHRISIHGGSMAPPRYSFDSSGRIHLDWSAYDAEVAPFLDGSILGARQPLPGARFTSIDVRTPASLQSDEERIAYWTEWTQHFQQNGWLDRLFLYLWDEPSKSDFPQLLQRGRAAAGVSPPLRDLVTTIYTQQLAPVVQIWVPLVNCLEPKPGFDDPCLQTPPLSSYAAEIQKGKQVWFYQSCASHGCSSTGGSYYVGWPSYMIDISAPANRVMQWVAWKYRMEGELYYSMNQAYSSGTDPWESVYLFGGNGDGTLFYPGRPDRIGGSTDIPIESIRLKLIREGMEDYEYLALLSKLAGPDAADHYAARIVRKPYNWDSRPEAFLSVRMEMGRDLNRLAAGPGGPDAR